MTLYLGENLISGVAYPTEPTRNIGQIIQSTIPLTDAGLHLLDGSLIDGSGIYSAFVTYISGLVTDYSDLFCTEAEWQTSVNNYGSCDRYVYDSVNNTVRLPKRNSEHGKLIKTYINGTTNYRIYEDGYCEQFWRASLPGSVNSTLSLPLPFKDTNYYVGAAILDVDDLTPLGIATYPRTNSTFWALAAFNGTGYTQPAVLTACGFVDITDYQYSAIYEYIVLATSIKTDIQVDIDEIATDLNGKADVDLSNLNNTGTSAIVHNTRTSNNYYPYTLGASGSTYTMLFDGQITFLAQAPSDGQNHGPWISLTNQTNGDQFNNNGTYDVGFSATLNVSKGDVVRANYGNQATGQLGRLRLYACKGNESEVQ